MGTSANVRSPVDTTIPARGCELLMMVELRVRRAPANGRNRRNLVVPARSGEGPLTILFADLRHRECKPVVCSVHDLRPGEPLEGELGGGIGIIRNEAGAQDTPNPSKTHRTDGWFHDGAFPSFRSRQPTWAQMVVATL